MKGNILKNGKKFLCAKQKGNPILVLLYLVLLGVTFLTKRPLTYDRVYIFP